MFLTEDYIISIFYEYAYQPKHNRYNKTYQGGCPICREGGSLGKKRRCYYIPKNDNIFCHNCGWSSKPLAWIKRVSNKTDLDIINELRNKDDIIPELKEEPVVKIVNSETLPKDSINLNDIAQVNFYKDNNVIAECLKLIEARRLNTAVNRPKDLFVSLSDTVHKNRLIIPFKTETGDIVFYQSRTVIEKDKKIKPKYISKVNAEKTIFNIDQIDNEKQNVYIFEGPLNSFFVKNGVAVAGITERGQATFTLRQQQQINTTLSWFNKIWVLDSQWIDNASLKKTGILLRQGEHMFIWPEKFGKRFKDFNDICIACKIDSISEEFIQKNTFHGLEGILRLSKIQGSR
jgi:hypothetical protein